MFRNTSLLSYAVAAGLALAMSVPISLAQKSQKTAAGEPKGNTHAGEVVSTANGQLTMTMDGKQQHSHTVTAETEITLNDRPAALGDLQKGDAIQVTVGQNNVALAIQATRKNATLPRPESQQDAPGIEQPDQASPAEQGGGFLGVALAPSTGAGVFIPDVAPQGPAEQAGIRGGDYILSINGRDVSSPQQLDDMIFRMQPGQTITIVAWRDGQEREVTARLGKQQTAGFRGFAPQPRRGAATNEPAAWLGVMLVDTDDHQVKIEQAHPQGPAAEAGIREGDMLVSINGKKLADSDAVASFLEQTKPGDKVEIVVAREGKQQTINATLGDRTGFFRNETGDSVEFGNSGKLPEHFMILEQHRRFAEQHQRIEDLCEQLLKEIQELRKEVETLKQNSGTK